MAQLSTADVAFTTRTASIVPRVRKATTANQPISNSNSRATTTASTSLLHVFYTTELASSPPTNSKAEHGNNATTQQNVTINVDSTPPTPSITTHEKLGTTQEKLITTQKILTTTEKEMNINGYNSTLNQTITVPNRSAETSRNDVNITPTTSQMSTPHISLQNSSIEAVDHVTTQLSYIDRDIDRHFDSESDRNIDKDANRSIDADADRYIKKVAATDTHEDAHGHSEHADGHSEHDAGTDVDGHDEEHMEHGADTDSAGDDEAHLHSSANADNKNQEGNIENSVVTKL
jgi:hypothetical protein